MTNDNNEFIINTPFGKEIVRKKSGYWTSEYYYEIKNGRRYEHTNYEGTNTFKTNIIPIKDY